MNLEQISLLKLMEECNEVSHKASKAIRFGLKDSGPEQLLNNKEQLQEELLDLLAVIDYLIDQDILDEDYLHGTHDQIEERKAKIVKFNNYSKSVGRLKED